MDTHDDRFIILTGAEHSLEALKAAMKRPEMCVWHREPSSRLWISSCGREWEMHRSPIENDMWFCPMCGRQIDQASEEARERGA